MLGAHGAEFAGEKRLVEVRCRPTYAGQVRVRGVTNPPLFTMQLTLLR